MGTRRHLIARLTSKQAAHIYRDLADQHDRVGSGVRLFAWRRFLVAFETKK
ncbi:hypothetical protein KHQ84_gp100 [Rhodococcus phage Finch]|uniref:Uncharacterized protein n=1 Tax=Rhodococcus phage Finch TaxID=2094144 RepID=A0A2P1JXI7_9CAUD|nr:hypothetical protein KHQ84_gp100 [Rhodococcus phage Finch]AVO25032.1 hypothetical protein SEA_FINCH_100 [Rhodococcus phage Finch]